MRCSGDRPICKRCSRLGHTCIYSTPEVRRTSRPTPGFTTSDKPPLPLSSISRGRSLSTLSHQDDQVTSHAFHASPPLLANPSEEYYLGIPLSLVSTLVEVYYSNVYNATLLLHKPSFLEALASGTAPIHIVLSVCAFASKYTTPSLSVIWLINISASIAMQMMWPRLKNTVS